MYSNLLYLITCKFLILIKKYEINLSTLKLNNINLYIIKYNIFK